VATAPQFLANWFDCVQAFIWRGMHGPDGHYRDVWSFGERFQLPFISGEIGI
jgi:hypothetical protein